MADFDALDELLSGSLKRAAQPGDSAGVADTIRARVAAGDTGTPAPSSGSAPGFGGGLGWIPWVGAIVVLGLVGGTLGATGVFGHPVQKVTSAVDSILMPPTVQGTSCPDGPVIGSVERGSRVIALARNADGSEVQIRNPRDVGQLLWVPTSQVDADAGEKAVADLPVGNACPTVSVAQAPVVVPVTPVTPTKPKDTTPPVIGAITIANPMTCSPTVTAQISDNVGVTAATVTWDHPDVGSSKSAAMAHAGGTAWTKTLAIQTNYTAIVNITITARDAVGNSASKASKFVTFCPVG